MEKSNQNGEDAASDEEEEEDEDEDEDDLRVDEAKVDESKQMDFAKVEKRVGFSFVRKGCSGLVVNRHTSKLTFGANLFSYKNLMSQI